jgi:hypothetical protein
LPHQKQTQSFSQALIQASQSNDRFKLKKLQLKGLSVDRIDLIEASVAGQVLELDLSYNTLSSLKNVE